MKRFLAVCIGAGLVWATGQFSLAQDRKPAGTNSPAVPPNVASIINREGDRPIEPQDDIELTVVGEKELEKLPIHVEGSGEIRVPYIKDPVPAAGKTPKELKLTLEARWKENVFVDPQVVLRVTTYRKRVFSVGGKVMKPLLYDLPGEQSIDIVAAINGAGGFAPTANEKKIEFNRAGQKVQIFKWDNLLKETNPANKIYLEPGDSIYVHDSTF